MDSTITIIIAAITIIIAVVIGLLKFRPKSEKPEKSADNEFVLIGLGTENNKKNRKHDKSVFNRLQIFIDSNWIRNFECNQLAYPQYVQVAITDDLHAYSNESRKSENEFSSQTLAEAHRVFIEAIKAFINTVLQETTFVRPESNASVINSKAEGNRKGSQDYDKRYDREVKIITRKAKGIINAYKRYVQTAGDEGVY